MRTIALILIAMTLLLSGCIYANVQRPMDTQFDNTQLGNKVGIANSYCVLWLVAWGDAGSKAAADQGGITVIKNADSRVYSILFGLYSRVTTVVYGD